MFFFLYIPQTQHTHTHTHTPQGVFQEFAQEGGGQMSSAKILNEGGGGRGVKEGERGEEMERWSECVYVHCTCSVHVFVCIKCVCVCVSEKLVILHV